MARGIATVLFTDLVGSTELSVAYGERYHTARRAHDALLRSVVEANGGTVVKGLGDGVMATFPAVADGVEAAREAQQGIHRLNRRQPEPALSIRVGLSVGDVVWEDGDCFGEAVVQAARLCAAAAGDQILAASVVPALAGGSRGEGFAGLGPRALKGLPEPLDVVDVLWDVPESSGVPLPARLAAELPSFVGRAVELEELHRAYRDVEEQRTRKVVLVGGEPGVGKTTILSRVIRLWYDAGATVAMGRCDEDVRAPYGAFVEALGQLVAGAPVEVLQAHVARYGASLLPLAPVLASRIDDLPAPSSRDPESERFLLFAAVGDFLASLSEHAPLVLFLDDVHWADAGTASLLRSLATAPEPARLMITGTFRSDELPPDGPMGQAFAAFRRVDAVTRLQLEGLRSSEIAELVEQWTGRSGAGADQLADDIAVETGGNAFFVTEVMRHLHETGALDALSHDAGGARLVPESVREVLGERVARLGSLGDQVLGAAAVIGSEFALPLLSAVTGADDAKLLAVLDEAASAALVREVPDSPGRFVFTHALVQHAILANLGSTREAALHRKIAELLESDHEGQLPVARLAHHWLQATNVSDNSRARDWAIQAGDAALESLAPGDAVTYYRQALLLHDQLRDPDVSMRIDLLTRLGNAERQSGDPEHRDTLLKACRLAQRQGDTVRLADAALANTSGTFAVFQEIDDERVRMLEVAIDGVTEPRRRALLIATLANELTYSGDFDRRRRLADEALETARTVGDPELLIRCINLCFYAIWIPETLDERLHLIEEARDLMVDVFDPLARYWTCTSAYLNYVQAGRVLEGESYMATADELAERLAQPALLWRTHHREACRLLLHGDYEAAKPWVLSSFEYGDTAGQPEAIVYLKTQNATIKWQDGTLDEIAAKINGDAPRPPNGLASICMIYSEGDQLEKAAVLLDQAVARRFADLTKDPAYITCLAYYSESAIRLRHVVAAEILHELLEPFRGQVAFDGVAVAGGLDHHLGGLLGVLGRHDEAIEHLRASAELHAGIHAPFFEARDRHDLAEVLLARGGPGDRDAAAAEAALAVDLATDRYPRELERASLLLATIKGG